MNKCPRPINTEANDGSEQWCQENGHCGCVPFSILRQKYGEALYPTTHLERITCPKCGQPQVVKVIHTVPFNSYAHECSCGYSMTEKDWEWDFSARQKNIPPEFVKIVEENFWELLQ